MSYNSILKELNNMSDNNMCTICCNIITKENYVFCKMDNTWKLSLFCSECINILLNSKWNDYINNIKNIDCENSLKNLLKHKLPNKLSYNGGFYEPYIDELFINNQIYSSILVKPNNININELELNLQQLYNNIINDNNYDYINDINNIIKNYKL